MPTFRLLRCSGLALVLAAVLFVAAEILAFFLIVEQGDSYDFRRIATTGTFFLQSFLTLFAGALLAGGLVGFYARQSEAAGRLGLAGFVLAFFGTILLVGSSYATTLVAPMVAREAPAFLDSPLSGFLQLWLPFSFTPLAFSWLMLAVATARARVYSRSSSWFLLTGAAVALVPFPLTNLPFDTALAYLGFVLLTTPHAPPIGAVQPLRRSVAKAHNRRNGHAILASANALSRWHRRVTPSFLVPGYQGPQGVNSHPRNLNPKSLAPSLSR